MAFDMDPNYKQVPERIADFKAKHPEGCLRPVNPERPYWFEQIDGQTFLVYAAAAYRTPDDPLPGIGLAWELFPGRTPYTKLSELQNAETSAWGRAIVAVLASESKSVASAEDVRNRQADHDTPPPTEDQLAQRDGWRDVSEWLASRDKLTAVVEGLDERTRARFQKWCADEGLRMPGPRAHWERAYAKALEKANPGRSVTHDPLGGPGAGEPIIGEPGSAPEWCPMCDHSAAVHDGDGHCWEGIPNPADRVPGSAQCPCAVWMPVAPEVASDPAEHRWTDEDVAARRDAAMESLAQAREVARMGVEAVEVVERAGLPPVPEGPPGDLTDEEQVLIAGAPAALVDEVAAAVRGMRLPTIDRLLQERNLINDDESAARRRRLVGHLIATRLRQPEHVE